MIDGGVCAPKPREIVEVRLSELLDAHRIDPAMVWRYPMHKNVTAVTSTNIPRDMVLIRFDYSTPCITTLGGK